jgi:hypothetical protein
MRFLMGVKLDYNCRLTPLAAAEQFYIYTHAAAQPIVHTKWSCV